MDAAVKLMRTRIRLLAQPKSMSSIIDATRREQRRGLSKWGVFCHTNTLQITPPISNKLNLTIAFFRKRPDPHLLAQEFFALRQELRPADQVLQLWCGLF